MLQFLPTPIRMAHVLVVAVSLLLILSPFQTIVSVATTVAAFNSIPRSVRSIQKQIQNMHSLQTCVQRLQQSPQRSSTSLFSRKNKKMNDSGSSEENEEKEPPQQKIEVPTFHFNWTLTNLFLMENVQPLLDMQITSKNDASASNSKEIESFLSHGFIPPRVESFRRFTRSYDYDMGHDGRFTLFGSPHGASLQPDVVFSMDRPLSYIRDVLSYGGDPQFPVSDEAVVFAPSMNTLHHYDKGNGKEMPPFVPCQLQQRTSPTRVAYYSKVLGDLAIAQIHTGTHLDQGDIEIDTPFQQTSLDALLSEHHLLNNLERQQIQTKGKIRLRVHDRDKVRLILSARDHLDTALKNTIVRLIDAAVTSVLGEEGQEEGNNDDDPRQKRERKRRKIRKLPPQPHLVLMVYGSSSVHAAVALQAWKDKAKQKMQSKKKMNTVQQHQQQYDDVDIEGFLRQAVTVVTISSVSRCFPDGPAYIHVSMMDDSLTLSLGATSKNRKGGGKDAIYLEALSPYYWSPHNNKSKTKSKNKRDSNSDGFQDQSQRPNQYNQDLDTNDSHNMDACAIQFLAIIMRVNGIRSFRKLYEMGSRDTKEDLPSHLCLCAPQKNELDIPPNLDEELLPAMIRATQGYQWLWDPETSLGNGGVDGLDSPIPSKDDADFVLGEQYGYDAYDEIVEACNSLDVGTSTGRTDVKS